MRQKWGLRPPGRWLHRTGGALLAIVLIAMGSPSANGAVAAPGAGAVPQMTPEKHLEILASVGKNYLKRLRPEVAARLSTGGKALLRLAEQSERTQQLAAQGRAAAARTTTVRPQGPRTTKPGLANDTLAAEDLFTRLGGMTQSETSAAWCGSNALIGFNDSGSFVATEFLALSPSGSLSFAGWSQSTDAGATYTDRGALIADPIPARLAFRDLLGDPVLGCTSSRNFYYTTISMDIGPNEDFVESGIAVSPSTDGGTTFGAAVVAVAKDAFFHALDKPWFAVEAGPTPAASDDVLHVVYTDFDFTGFIGEGLCPDDIRTGLEYVRSLDGGATWSSPIVLDEVCGFDGNLQAGQVEAGLGDDVHVAWEFFPFESEASREIRIARSTNLGASFGPTVTAASITGIGDGFVLQGLFRVGLDLQGLAVDRTNGSRRGTIYITFHDGSNRTKHDPLGFCAGQPLYCFGDAWVIKSTNRGATWSAPVRINNDDVRLGIDQWFPNIDVDRSGTLWTVFHDRRRDERNVLIDTFVAKSTDGGATWTNVRATKDSFAAITGWPDVFVNPLYMGDYLAVAADSTGRYSGAIAAWGDNTLGDPNIVQRRFEG